MPLYQILYKVIAEKGIELDKVFKAAELLLLSWFVLFKTGSLDKKQGAFSSKI